MFSSYQDDRERKLNNMEERMKEVELSLHNVKLLLREKVAQLKEQVSFVQVAERPLHPLHVDEWGRRTAAAERAAPDVGPLSHNPPE